MYSICKPRHFVCCWRFSQACLIIEPCYSQIAFKLDVGSSFGLRIVNLPLYVVVCLWLSIFLDYCQVATPSITLGECVRSQWHGITCKIRPGFPSDFAQSCKESLEQRDWVRGSVVPRPFPGWDGLGGSGWRVSCTFLSPVAQHLRDKLAQVRVSWLINDHISLAKGRHTTAGDPIPGFLSCTGIDRCDDPSLVAVTYTAVFPHPPAAWSSGWPTRRPVLSAGRDAFNAMWSNSLSILVTPPCSTLHSQWNLMKWRWAEWGWDPQHRNGNTHMHVHYLHSGEQLHSKVWWMIEFLSLTDVCISKMLLCDGC